MTQSKQILKYLSNGHSLTPRKAQVEFGVMRLAARIKDLRDDGHAVRSEMVEVPTRNGTARVARYSLSA
jgi:hypothetical protein